MTAVVSEVPEPEAEPRAEAGSGGCGDRAGGLDRVHPVLAAMGGAASNSTSAAFAKLSGAGAGTAAFLRCALALIALLPLAAAEYRTRGPRPARLVAVDAAAGVLLGVDYVFWARSIGDVGASIATVLINVQVVVFPLLAWGLSGVRPTGRFALAAPVMLGGVAFASGAVGQAAPGGSPVSGALSGVAAGVAYAGYLFLTRSAGGTGHSAAPVFVSTLSAAAAAAVLGGLWMGIDLDLPLASWGWLAALALLGQVMSWLLIGSALPRLAPATGSALLLIQPILALAVGAAFLNEYPSPTQLGGCALVLLAVWALAGERPKSDG
ncbi:EamA-like transporter family protein [Streptomonospora litoralis]|uniref:EamA-like transporter family protein n=2 Tax=Streptomonospora litoralis TaxID=2498135 RepID=A0A4P6PZH4_9ACTN|nr:EamA-like transporter family protein [Streptomonospora litoralis]